MRITRERRVYFFLLFWFLIRFVYDGAYSLYVTKYLYSLGLDEAAIGVIAAIGSALALVSQPLWGAIGDRARSKNAVLQIATLLTAGATALYIAIPAGKLAAVGLAAAYGLAAVFRAPCGTLTETITLEWLEERGKPFGPVRLMGTIGWSLAGLCAGALFSLDMRLFAPVCAGLALLLALTQRFAPRIAGHRRPKQKADWRGFFANPAVVPIVVYGALKAFGNGLSSSYFNIYFTSQLGGNDSVYGVYVFLVTMTELPFLFFADKILNRFGAVKTLAAGGAFGIVRALYIFLVPSYQWLFALVLIQGVSILEAFVALVALNRAAPPELKVTAQAVYALVTSLSSTLSVFLSGYIIKYIYAGSIAPAYLSTAVIFAAATGYIVTVMLKSKRKNIIQPKP